jgi:enoyl-CoA hydratase/carnithine racemase
MSVISIEAEGPVTIVSINRPEKLNAINKQVAIDLQAAFAEFDRSEQRVAVLTGAGGRAFSAGADVTDLPELWRCVPSVGIMTEKPIVAAVRGWCIGGGLVMAMMCDLLVAAEDAKFSYPEGKVGITGGMIAGLAARIPHKIAMEMMLVASPSAPSAPTRRGSPTKSLLTDRRSRRPSPTPGRSCIWRRSRWRR